MCVCVRFFLHTNSILVKKCEISLQEATRRYVIQAKKSSPYPESGWLCVWCVVCAWPVVNQSNIVTGVNWHFYRHVSIAAYSIRRRVLHQHTHTLAHAFGQHWTFSSATDNAINKNDKRMEGTKKWIDERLTSIWWKESCCCCHRRPSILSFLSSYSSSYVAQRLMTPLVGAPNGKAEKKSATKMKNFAHNTIQRVLPCTLHAWQIT